MVKAKVPMPVNADHAALMFNLAHEWLRLHAPERFTEEHRKLVERGRPFDRLRRCAARSRRPKRS